MILLTLLISSPSSWLLWVSMMVKTEWERLLLSFMPVAAVARNLLPIASQCCGQRTHHSHVSLCVCVYVCTYVHASIIHSCVTHFNVCKRRYYISVEECGGDTSHTNYTPTYVHTSYRHKRTYVLSEDYCSHSHRITVNAIFQLKCKL